MLSRLGTLVLAALLAPLPAFADGNSQSGQSQQGNNSFNDPFSPYNPNSMAAKNREQQERMLEKQRETWRDRFNQRRDSGWKDPPGTRFFSRMFRSPQLTPTDAGSGKRWGADIFTRFFRIRRSFSTVTTGTSGARIVDKVSRNALFENTGAFGKEVQRAVADTRFSYWDRMGGEKGKLPLVKPERKVKQPTRWSRPERRSDRASGSAGTGRFDRQRGWKIHKAAPTPSRRMANPPVWRVRQR
jgi:hypothetical protein